MRRMYMVTITKNELIQLGFGVSQAQDIIRRSKALMIKKGYEYYRSRRLGRVPVQAVEEILGMKLADSKEVKHYA